MDHVSRPLLIALVAIIGFAGVWFAALRPKPIEGGGGPAPAPPSGQALRDTASPAQAAPAAGRATRPAGARAAGSHDRSAPILGELAHGKVAVLLFWNPRGADDRAARRAVRAVSRHGGRVTVHVASVERVGDYQAITRDVEVLQSPTVLVIGPDRRARTIVGYTDLEEVEQLVGDVGGARLRR